MARNLRSRPLLGAGGPEPFARLCIQPPFGGRHGERDRWGERGWSEKPRDASTERLAHYDGPSGGWGSLRGIASVFGREWATPAAIETLARQNKPHGFMCVSCSWAKPESYHPFEFCENGAKATLWELATRRCTPEFFARHSVSELLEWNDYDLEQQGRLTHPMRYDPAADRYVRCAWEEAFAAIGDELRTLDPTRHSAAQASRRLISTRCSRGCTARTICPTAPTCATRRRRSLSRPRSAQGSAPSCSTTSQNATPCSFSGRTLGPTVPASCTRSRTPPSAASRSSCSTQCERKDLRSSPTPRTCWKCSRGARPGSAGNIIRCGRAETSR